MCDHLFLEMLKTRRNLALGDHGEQKSAYLPIKLTILVLKLVFLIFCFSDFFARLLPPTFPSVNLFVIYRVSRFLICLPAVPFAISRIC